MKQLYMKPLTETHILFDVMNMIAATIQEDPESGRFSGGDPANPESGGPAIGGSVGGAGDNTDPFAGKGSGTGGSGSRAKSGMIWDEW